MVDYKFGKGHYPGNPILDRAERMDVPVGRACDYCSEVFKEDEPGYGVALAAGMPMLIAHNDCFLVATGIIPAFHDDEDVWPPTHQATRRERAASAVAEALAMNSTASKSKLGA